MNRTIISFVLFVLLSIGIVSAKDISLASAQSPSSTGNTQPSRVRRVVIPFTADITNNVLSVNFASSVGIVTIIITDENGIVVNQELNDTYTTLDVYIPVTNFVSGNYSLIVQYGSATFSGNFQL